MSQAWAKFVSFNIPTNIRIEQNLVLQLILSRMFKKIIARKAQNKSQSISTEAHVPPLTDIESNAVRYMAGYVAVALLKRYRKKSDA